ncbi:DEAD/DEAH box helicase [Haloprofundus halobius]|uniref:DEAD/DEAH box helicase n=1 Tax=Haloprofundus halobius TaxID=2876194 RepID=UPI001CCCF5D1|nr:DEAD/DEAH box helicase family protein [Haloprofundus halobius]
MNIDKLADSIADQKTPREIFQKEWLGGMPEAQWPSYIDESATLVMEGITIGDTNLTKGDFSSETGDLYRRGLARTTGRQRSETSLPVGSVSGRDLGIVMWALNGLKEDIESSRHTNYTSTSRAVEAVLNKAMIGAVADQKFDYTDFERIRLPEGAAVTDLMAELFCRPRSDAFVDALVEISEESRRSGESLLQLLEQPKMVTPLWEHQREALAEWLDSGCRGYVDMATATGKTFLGLATIAHHFGDLHPNDTDLTRKNLRPDTDGDATVVVVAHRSVILDQWKREFDRHLNIPKEASASDGEYTARYSWGEVHFWTPNRLLERDVPDADLVVLDETHHYVGGSGFGALLDQMSGHLLALSGSLNEKNSNTLERRQIPKLFEFSLRDGQRVGIIPQCDWHVRIVPFEGQSTLAEVTEQYRTGYDQYSDGSAASVLEDVADAQLSFNSLSEARSVTQSRYGREVKERDDNFRKFSAATKSRGLTKYNLSPTLSAITTITLNHVHDHKCVVLLNSGDEIETVVSGLRRELGENFDDLVIDLDSYDGDPLEAIESFDEKREVGVIIGTASTLGEGVDIKTADVGINRSSGRLSHSLVQRIGRILRNPDGDKRATFYHVVGIPTEEDAVLLKEDGQELLDMASQLVTWGESFDARPGFETMGVGVDESLYQLEQHGAHGILESDSYSWPTNENARERLLGICEEIRGSEESVLLKMDPQLTSGTRPSNRTNYVSSHSDSKIELPMTLLKAVSEHVEGNASIGHDSRFIEQAIREGLEEIEITKIGDSESDSNTDFLSAVEINPVLCSVLRVALASTGVSSSEFAQMAVKKALSKHVTNNKGAFDASTLQ